MPKTDNYFQLVFRRENKIRKALLEFFFSISSYPRMLLEVFTRKHFGERYFTFLSMAMTAIIMAYVPFMLTGNFDFSLPSHYRYGEETFWEKYATWYVYLLLFLTAAGWHLDEIRKDGSIMKHQRFSLSNGILNPIFSKVKLPAMSDYILEVFLEPLPFFIGGVILWKFGQPLGMLLIVCSIIYFFSYVEAFGKGRDFVMDKLDEMIFNEELENVFVHDKRPENARGVHVFSDKPSSEELRTKTYNAMRGTEETAAAL